MKKYKMEIDSKPYDVTVVDVDGNTATVEVNGVKYSVKVDKEVKTTKTPTLLRSKVEPSTESDKAIAKTSSPFSAKGTGHIKAPLPGTVVQVLIQRGAHVKIGDNLLILEAMKMENTLRADKEGVIEKILVKPGDAVLEGDLLMEILTAKQKEE